MERVDEQRIYDLVSLLENEINFVYRGDMSGVDLMVKLVQCKGLYFQEQVSFLLSVLNEKLCDG